MKHYLAYDSEGTLVGIHTHHHAGTRLGGWPDDIRLDNPNCPSPTSRWFRENVVGKNRCVGFIALNCECSPTETTCDCANKDFASKKVVNGALVSKLEGALLNGITLLQNDSTIQAAPGTKLTMKVLCVGVLDGSTVTVYQRGGVVLDSISVVLTFTDGQTNTFEVTVPAQGISVRLTILGKETLGLVTTVLGWA